jgi:hypothetical protein
MTGNGVIRVKVFDGLISNCQILPSENMIGMFREPYSKVSRWNFFRKPILTFIKSGIWNHWFSKMSRIQHILPLVMKLCFLMELDKGLRSVLVPWTGGSFPWVTNLWGWAQNFKGAYTVEMGEFKRLNISFFLETWAWLFEILLGIYFVLSRSCQISREFGPHER